MQFYLIASPSYTIFLPKHKARHLRFHTFFSLALRFLFNSSTLVFSLIFLESALSSSCYCKFISSSLLLLHHWFLYFFVFLLFVYFLPLLKGHHYFIVMLVFRFLMWPICSIAAIVVASLFTTIVASTHKVGGVLNFFKFFKMLLICLIFIYHNLYAFKQRGHIGHIYLS